MTNWNGVEMDSSLFAAHSYLFNSTAVYLESQQAAVDLCSLNQSAAVVAADVCATLVSSQIDQ